MLGISRGIAILEYPIISPLYTCIDEGNALQFRRDDYQTIFIEGSHSLLRDLLPLLDGSNSIALICKKLSQYSSELLKQTIQQLHSQNIIVNNHDSSAVTWQSISRILSQKDIQHFPLHIICHEIYMDEIKRLVSFLGDITFVEDPQQAELTVICEPGFKPSFLYNWNTIATKPWLRISWTTSDAEIGPLFVPQQTPCYECFTKRLLSNRRFRDSYNRYENVIEKHHGIPQKPFIPSFLWCMSHALIEILRFATKYAPPQLYGRLLHLEWQEFKQSLEYVLKIPRCQGCK